MMQPADREVHAPIKNIANIPTAIYINSYRAMSMLQLLVPKLSANREAYIQQVSNICTVSSIDDLEIYLASLIAHIVF